MTREEARDKLIDHRARLDMIIKMAYGEKAEVSESFDIAIQALETLDDIKTEIKEYINRNPTSDIQRHRNGALLLVLDIIDRHTGKERMNEADN